MRLDVSEARQGSTNHQYVQIQAYLISSSKNVVYVGLSRALDVFRLQKCCGAAAERLVT